MKIPGLENLDQIPEKTDKMLVKLDRIIELMEELVRIESDGLDQE